MPETLDDPLLTTDYRQAPGVYDEMCLEPGVLRPHWDRYIASLSSLGGKELADRTAAHPGKRGQLQRLWRSSGHRPPVEPGCDPAAHPSCGMELSGSGSDPARPLAQHDSCRSLRPP